MSSYNIEYQIEHYPNGKIKYERWYKNGKFHRDTDLPSKITYFENGQKNYEYYYKDGILSRDKDLPAVIRYNRLNNISAKYQETWYSNGKIHRDNKPAVLTYSSNRIIEEIWYQNGIIRKSNPDEAARITYSYLSNNTKRTYYFYKDYKIHRDNDLPAIIETENLNEDTYEVHHYYQKGLKHRDEDKPAKIYYFNNVSYKYKWFKYDHLHRDNDKPAEVYTKINEFIDPQSNYSKTEIWYQNGLKHRENLPAEIYYYDQDGRNKKIEKYYHQNLLNNNQDAAWIYYFPDGQKKSETWYKDSKEYREDDLPSHLEYHQNGNISLEAWYENIIFRVGYTKDHYPKPSAIAYHENGEINELAYIFATKITYIHLTLEDCLKYYSIIRRKCLKYKREKRSKFFNKLNVIKTGINNKQIYSIILKYI